MPNIDLDNLLYEPAETEEASAQHIAGSGSLDRLVDRARGYTETAAAKNANKA